MEEVGLPSIRVAPPCQGLRWASWPEPCLREARGAVEAAGAEQAQKHGKLEEQCHSFHQSVIPSVGG